MIFIFEQQTPFIKPENETLSRVSTYIRVSPYIEACRLYKALYLLKIDELLEIKEVHYLATEEIDVSLYKGCFKGYKADVTAYSDDRETICEISHEFPDVDELNETEKVKHIEKLIRGLSVYAASSDEQLRKYIEKVSKEGKSCLLYLPYCKSNSESLLRLYRDIKIRLYSDEWSLNGYSDKGYICIEIKKYLEIKNKLEAIRPQVALQAREFNTPPGGELLLELGEGFLNKIIDLKNSQRKTRFHLYGKDRFIARRTIEKILQGKDHVPYYMPFDLKIVEKKDKSVVIYDFERLEDPRSHKTLFDKIIDASKLYIILQACRNVNTPYLEKFVSVELPCPESYENSITNIFLGFLIGGYKYTDQKRKLGSFHGNMLKELIPKINSLEDLFNSVEDLRDIKFQDLTDNAGFWYYLDYLLNKQTDKVSLEKQKEVMTIEKTKGGWIVYSQHNPFETDMVGMLYLTIILHAYKRFGETLTTAEIRNIAIEYLGNIEKKKERQSIIENTPSHDLIERDRKAISSAFSSKKYGLARYWFYEEFIKRYIEPRSGKYYFVDNNEVEVEVFDPKLTDSLFTDQISKRKQNKHS